MATDAVRSGIDVLDSVLPKGIPRTNLVIIAGEPGTAKSVMLQNLAYNFLNLLKEPIIFVTLDEPADATVRDMSNFGWNLHPFVKEGAVAFLDCFSFRMEPRQKIDYIEIIKNPKDVASLTDTIFRILDKMNMNNRGAVFIDSLTELLMFQTEKMFFAEVLEGMKTWRARGPKERAVLFFATYHLGIEVLREIEQSLTYMIDGIIELRFTPELFEKGSLNRELRVRKMRGVPHLTNWVTFSVSQKGITGGRARKR